MIDLTAITTPFGLLDAETQEALRAHGGPYEVWEGRRWIIPSREALIKCDGAFVYRVKPAPPKPREWWIVNGSVAFPAFDQAKSVCDGHPDYTITHVREVLP